MQQSANNVFPLSFSCARGHIPVVEVVKSPYQPCNMTLFLPLCSFHLEFHKPLSDWSRPSKIKSSFWNEHLWNRTFIFGNIKTYFAFYIYMK